MINAYCTWGDGPAILVAVDLNGNKQYFDLTKNEAEKLAWELQNAARWSEELEELAEKENV